MFKAVLRTSVYPIASTCISVKINGSFDDTQRRPGVAVCYLWKCNCTNLIFYQKIPKNFIKIVIVIKRYKKLAQGNSTWAPWISVHFLKPFDTASHTRWHNSLPIGENVSSFRLLRTSTERLFCIYTCFLTKQQKKSKGGGECKIWAPYWLFGGFPPSYQKWETFSSKKLRTVFAWQAGAPSCAHIRGSYFMKGKIYKWKS